MPKIYNLQSTISATLSASSIVITIGVFRSLSALPLICFLFFLTNISISFSQSKSDTTLAAGWSIGVDMLPLINKGNVPVGTFLLKKVRQKNALTANALRFRIGATSRTRSTTSVTSYFPDEYKLYGGFIGVGYEKQRIFHKYRWMYGVDIQGDYAWGHDYYLFLPADSITENAHYRELNIGINGFVGFQYYLSSALSIGVESALLMGYNYKKKYDTVATYPYDIGGYSIDIDHIFNLDVKPIYTIHLFYQLKNISHHVKRKTN